MGNTPSTSDVEEEAVIKEMNVVVSDNEEGGGDKESPAVADLEILFDPTSLRAAAAKIKEEIPENIIQQYRYQIVRWLEDRETKLEETVTLSQFCDMLINKGVNRDEAIKAFQQFDTDGSVVVEVRTIIEAIRSMNGPNVMGELGKSIRMLQACSLTPGFVDVYAGDKHAVFEHGERILTYLLRNRAPSSCLPFPYLNGFNNTADMRISVLKSSFKDLKETVESGCSETALDDGEEVRSVSPCYSSVEASSNTADAFRLTDGDPNTFWQSDGAARSHWIRLHMRSNVVVKQLSVLVASSDSSYMPELVTVSAGKNINSLRELKEIRISGHHTGEVVLIKASKAHYSIIQINIKRCRNDGCDTRVHGIKAIGYRVIRDSGISVMDASAVWYLQILAATVSAAMPLAPNLQGHILDYTKQALKHIGPLSLCPASVDRPHFLTKHVLQELEKFLSQMAVGSHGQAIVEGMHMLLAFNLARCHVGGLIRTVKMLQENSNLTLPCTDLLLKMATARDLCWEQTGYQLHLTVCGTDGGKADDTKGPENVIIQSGSSTTNFYFTEEGKTKVNMFFKSTEYIQVTKFRVKVVPGVRGPRRGLVFVYRDSKDFNLDKHVERFQHYDRWGRLDYTFSVQVRNAGLAGKPDNPVAYFALEDDCDEVEVPVNWHPVGHYVCVKFLEPRHDSAGKIGIASIKLFGFTRKSVLVEEDNIRHLPNPTKNPSSSSLEIVESVLQFLIEMAQDQATRKGGSSKPEYMDLVDVPMDLLWKLYNDFNSGEEKWPKCAVQILKLIYCLIPAFSSLTGSSKTAAESLFQHLCKEIDRTGHEPASQHHKLCRQLIIDGAEIFFPDTDARRNQLLQMMQKVERLSDAPSVMLVFQSLCQFFSSVDPSGLLYLPKKPTETFDSTPVLFIMKTMIDVVTYQELTLALECGQTKEQLLHLLQLVNSLQTSLFSWCWAQMNGNEDGKHEEITHEKGRLLEVIALITKYAEYVSVKATDACRQLLKGDVKKLEELITKDRDVVSWLRCTTDVLRSVPMNFTDSLKLDFYLENMYCLLLFSLLLLVLLGYCPRSPDMPLSWPFDLQLGVTNYWDVYAVQSYTIHQCLQKRAFYRKNQRSRTSSAVNCGQQFPRWLSHWETSEIEAEETVVVLEFLWEMVNKREGLSTKLIEKSKEQCKGLKLGGGTFQNKGEISISDSIYQAYSTAESLRTHLLIQRQRLVVEVENKTGSEDADDPSTVCRDKALFLLKFAGLTKIQLKNELLKKLANRKTDKQIKTDNFDRFPSFRLVLEFVHDQAWTTDRVNRMLQERSQHARAVSDVYTFAAEFIRELSDDNSFQIPIVLFLQELLLYQDGFAKHYAEMLEGCGLELESKVRQSYYTLIRRLVEPYHQVRRHDLNKKIVSAYDFIQAALLHLLDSQWQLYDLEFLNDVRLPDLFLSIAKETVKMRDCTLMQQEEADEMAEYDQCMHWFDECSKITFLVWYNKKEDASKDDKKSIQMFVARFCDLLDVEISCDGCGVTLPGRRYRCLQCVDMDLCATCYSGGVKPEGEHTDEHDIVHLLYKCNKCQAFIVGTRVHCNICEDFDLCLGCHNKAAFPSGHQLSHDVTRFQLTKLKTAQETDSQIQAYIHQHVWMLFTKLALSMGDINNESTSMNIDPDYVKLAAQIQNQCISIVMQCLQQVPDDAEDSSKRRLEYGHQTFEKRQEEAFALHSQERVMGLLGAMLPQEDKTHLSEGTYNFITETFLRLLLKIARGDSGHEVNTRHLAMGLLGPLLTKCPAKIADASIEASKRTVSMLVPSVKEVDLEGEKTIQYLFTFGANCLEKSGLEWACSVARILQSLYNSSEWKVVLHMYLTRSIQNLAEKPELSSIFALFVMAGFPEVLTVGTIVSYSLSGVEKKTGVVLKHFPDKYQTLLIDVKSRKRHTINDKYVDCLSMVTEIWDTDHILLFLNIVGHIVSRIKAGIDDVSVECLWVLSLSLKILSNTLKSPDNSQLSHLYTSSFIQCLVHIASQGSGFSQQWLLKDLEVLSLMLYTHEGGSATTIKKNRIVSSPSELLTAALKRNAKKSVKSSSTSSSSDDNDLFETPTSSSASSSDENIDDDDEEEEIKALFEDLDEKAKLIFKAVRSDLKVPLSVLQVIYDMNDRNPDAVFKAILENFEESSADCKEMLKKWEGIIQVSSGTSSLSSKIIDTGIQYHPVFKYTERTITRATEENTVDAQKLIQAQDCELDDDMLNERRSKSSELLKQELEKHGKAGSHEYLSYVNMGMSVLFARQVLTRLLAYWPDSDHVISANLLGCKDVQQIPCVLDLLNKTESQDNFQKVVENVIRHCEPEALVPIACTACQFMEEAILSAVTCESQHCYKTDVEKKDSVQLHGAAYLIVSFDSRCNTREDEDELIIASSEDLSQNRNTMSGSARSRWNTFQIPGDKLYYKFTCSSGMKATGWGYKFTVTTGTRDSFQTGYSILSNVLSTNLAHSLPLSQLWSILAYVASKQTGSQRLKAIQLLLKIINTQHRSETNPKLLINLGLLKPFWQMYDNLTKQVGEPSSILPPVVRSLTELFLQVENLVIEWDMETEYLLAMQGMEELRKSVGQGILNVAAVSMKIGYQNVATDLALAVQRRKAVTST
ncbi:hypothetical protein ScPMuIL_011918 [Solemya velum]